MFMLCVVPSVVYFGKSLVDSRLVEMYVENVIVVYIFLKVIVIVCLLNVTCNETRYESHLLEIVYVK